MLRRIKDNINIGTITDVISNVNTSINRSIRTNNNKNNNKNEVYDIETYTLIKGVQLVNNNTVIVEAGPLELNEAQFITWKYLRGSDTLSDAFSNLNEELNNMISLETFKFITDDLTGMGVVYISSSESDICKYIEDDCKTVINAELLSDIRNKIYLRHLDMEIVVSSREYLLLKAIIKGEYESIDVKDWKTFFSLYKKEAISFI